MEKFSYLSPFLLFFLLSSLLSHTFAIPAKKSYIVYLGSHSLGRDPTAYDIELATESHYDILESVMGSKLAAEESILYSYNQYINGFAAVLDEEEAANLAKNPNVVLVFENKERKLHTTRSWNFLGVENDKGIPRNSIWNVARFGEDTIIGNLDTGVWPDSESFNDEGYGPIPSRWRGACKSDSKFHCNRKLIGARYFNLGFAAATGPLNSSFNTARDHQGHGTHTLSTAGGNFVAGANVFGSGNGTAKGGSPRARVAAYRVCWPLESGGCFDADILAAFEAAISDGVDVISVSLGGPAAEYLDDAVSIGSFHAVERGIAVVCSAGNEGPTPGSVSNVAPWIFTVGASTLDRDFASYVSLGNKKHIKGSSLSSKGLPARKFFPLINAADARATNASDADAQLCLARSLDPTNAKGKILVCLRGNNSRVAKSFEAARVGAAGMILINDEQSGSEVLADPHFLPSSHVNYVDGVQISQYINSTKLPMARVTRVKTEVGVKPAPTMAAFSSRGPNNIDESILKPDVTAPGTSIIAAVSGELTVTDIPSDTRRVSFNVESGTSMSCPHVSGIVGLFKNIHPEWSPAAIKSAVMTTAKARDNERHPILDSDNLKATPLAYGAGHVHPTRSIHPGLVYDTTTDDYLNYLCARGYNQKQLKLFSSKPFSCAKSFKPTDLNYPTISVPGLETGPVTVNRRVKNVGGAGTYVARVKAPPGVAVTVEPRRLQFNGVGEEKAFKVVLQHTGRSKRGGGGGYVFGRLVWSDGKHFVRSPIAVKMG